LVFNSDAHRDISVTFSERIEALVLKSKLSTTEQLAIDTYRRIQQVVARQSDEGLSRVFDYCARNAKSMAKANQALRGIEEQIAQAEGPSPALQVF